MYVPQCSCQTQLAPIISGMYVKVDLGTHVILWEMSYGEYIEQRGLSSCSISYYHKFPSDLELGEH